MNTSYDAIDALKRLPQLLLMRLLHRHEVSLRQVGLDPAQADAQTLRDRLDDLPESLIQRFCEIHLVATDREQLATVARRRGFPLTGARPIEDAATVLLDRPEAFNEAAARLSVEPTRPFCEYVGREPKAPTFDAVALAQTEEWLGEHFVNNGGLRYCQIHSWRDRHLRYFLVKHASARRLEQEVVENGAFTREGWPVGRDLVALDERIGNLRVGTNSHVNRERYRTVFGQLFHGDSRWFEQRQIVSFDPLRHPDVALRPTRGLSVRLVELMLELAVGTIKIRADDAIAAARSELGSLRLKAIRSARFELEHARGTRSLRISVPNGIAHAGWTDDQLAREFLEERGFLVRPLVPA